jgi:hypothetical protein
MTDYQLLTLCISFAVAIAGPAAAVIYSNSRITDTKETLRAELRELRADMKAGFDRLEMTLKIHELEHHK